MTKRYSNNPPLARRNDVGDRLLFGDGKPTALLALTHSGLQLAGDASLIRMARNTVLHEGEELFDRAETQLAACFDFLDSSMERAFGGVRLLT